MTNLRAVSPGSPASSGVPGGWRLSDPRGVFRPALGAVCHVLLEDPDLAAAIPRFDRDRAIDECTAPTLRIGRGWGSERIAMAQAGIGLLVLQGLLIRRVGVDGRFGAELLGDGDLLRPAQGEAVRTPLLYRTEWRVLQPTRIAVLDGRVTERFARYPGLIDGLVGRAIGRSLAFAVNMAIVQHPRVDVRLLMLFWHLTARWGRSTHDAIYLPLPLTHAVLGELVAARRPTVSRAVSDLAERGLVRAVDDGWLLSGAPPQQLLELRGSRESIDPTSESRHELAWEHGSAKLRP